MEYSALSSYFSDALAEMKWPKRPDGLYAPIRYTLEGGGKRLRPTLLLAACQAVGANPEQAISQAIGIEMFHNFTLLHDDVMDNADMRRGRPTVHLRWGVPTAILSGDAMLTMASQLIAKCPAEVLPRVLEEFNRTAMGVYEGQQYDMDFERQARVTVDEYLEMIRLKTAVLLGGACSIGAIMGGASDTITQALYDYGVNLGLAFQLEDDMLDTFGDPAIFGKEIGGDIVNDKKTWLLINALAEAREETRQALAMKHREEKVLAVTEIYVKLGLRERCRKLINEYIEKAIACLPQNIDGRAIDFFVDLAQKSMARVN